MTKGFFAGALLGIAATTSCTNMESTKEAMEGPDAVFREYRVWAEEGGEWATGLFQFFVNRKEKSSFELAGPASVALDGEVLAPDSAAVTGVFYEVRKPLQGFEGKHTITYTDANKKVYKDEFLFRPFRMVNRLGQKVNRSGLLLELEGVEDEDLIRVVATDTSLEGSGINEIDTVRNGQIDLRQRFDEEIVNGPVLLQLFREQELPLESKPRGGKISITYSVKREFDLED